MAVQSNSNFGSWANQLRNSNSLFFDSQLAREAIHAASTSANQVGVKEPPESTIWKRRLTILADHESLPMAPIRLLFVSQELRLRRALLMFHSAVLIVVLRLTRSLPRIRRFSSS